MISGYIMCQICYSYHESVEELSAHYESHHPSRSEVIQPNEEGRFACEFCDRSFTAKPSVYAHQRKAHGRVSAAKPARKANYEGDFPCAVCGKKLSTPRWLRHHMKAKHNVQE